MTDLCKVIHCRRRSRPQVTGDSASGDGRLSESVPHTVSTNDPRPLPPSPSLSLFTPTPYHLNSSGTDVFLCGGVSRISLSFVYFCTTGNPLLCGSTPPPHPLGLRPHPPHPFSTAFRYSALHRTACPCLVFALSKLYVFKYFHSAIGYLVV